MIKRMSMAVVGVAVLVSIAACGAGSPTPTLTPSPPEATPTPTAVAPTATSTPTVVAPAATPTANAPDSAQAALLQAQERWEHSGIADYSYTGAWTCFCPEDYRADTQVTVGGGKVTAVSSAAPNVGTIPAPERVRSHRGPVRAHPRRHYAERRPHRSLLQRNVWLPCGTVHRLRRTHGGRRRQVHDQQLHASITAAHAEHGASGGWRRRGLTMPARAKTRRDTSVR